MWPDAKMKDKGMFEHLNFEFDLSSGKVVGETAAKDYHGVPFYQYVYDPAAHTATEIINVEPEVSGGIETHNLPDPTPAAPVNIPVAMPETESVESVEQAEA